MQGVIILYSATAADMHASLLLHLKKVNTESSIFIIELKIYRVRNVNNYVNTFSFSKKLLLGENTFFMEYLRATASSRYPPEKLLRKFWKIPQKTPDPAGDLVFISNFILFLKLL